MVNVGTYSSRDAGFCTCFYFCNPHFVPLISSLVTKDAGWRIFLVLEDREPTSSLSSELQIVFRYHGPNELNDPWLCKMMGPFSKG